MNFYYAYTFWFREARMYCSCLQTGPSSLDSPELPALSWWRRGPDAENLCQRCLCSSDSICPAYHFPSAPPQLMAVSGVLSRHFPHPANRAKVSGPRVIIADRALSPPASVCLRLKRVFGNIRDTLWSYKYVVQGIAVRPWKTRAFQGTRASRSAVIWETASISFISTAVVSDISRIQSVWAFNFFKSSYLCCSKYDYNFLSIVNWIFYIIFEYVMNIFWLVGCRKSKHLINIEPMNRD